MNTIEKTPLTPDEAKTLPTVAIATQAQQHSYNQSFRTISVIIPKPGNVVRSAAFLVQETMPPELSEHGTPKPRSCIFYRVETFEDAIAIFAEPLPA